jgi:adenylate cyclase
VKKLAVLNPTAFKLSLVITLLMLAFCHFIGNNIQLFEIFELKLLDMRFKIRGTRPPADEIVIVAIDDTSIEHFGRWPWPRAIHAQLIDLLKADGAKAIGLDILFSEPQESTEFFILQQLRRYYRSLPIAETEPYGIQFAEILDQALKQSDDDALLAESIKKADNVVLPIVFQISGGPPEIPDERSGKQAGKDLENNEMPPPELLAGSDDLKNEALLSPELNAATFQQVLLPKNRKIFDAQIASGYSLPLPIFYNASKALGLVNFFPDTDGILRWATMTVAYNQQYYQPFPLRLLEIFREINSEDIRLVHGAGIQFGNLFIPLDKNNRLLINYYGPANCFQYYSYAQVIEKTLPPGTFQNKIVLVGYAATGLFDVVSTPFSEAMPGVEKHATVISNILKQDFLKRNHTAYLMDLIFILMTGLILGLVMPKFSSLQGAAVGIAGLVLICICNYLCFSYLRIWVNLIYPLLTLFLVSAGIILFKFFTEEKDKRFIQATFENYLSPDLIRQMCRDKVSPRLGGEVRIITAYFTDIRNFSAIAEKLAPEQLVEFLNEYLTAMTDILKDEMGTLDKYEGDAIIAFFGAPAELPDHALRACRTAVRMQAELLKLRKKWQEERGRWPKEISEIKMRIGISTGEIVVGNMGSKMRMNYTMIGDAVNIASRLENGCRFYNVYTLANESTLMSEFINEKGEQKKVRDMVGARFIDKAVVAGKSNPVKIYEIYAMKGELSEAETDLFNLFDNAMDDYLKRKWDDAITKFGNCLEIEEKFGKSSPSYVFKNRCEMYKENPPPENWDGISRLPK